MPKIPIHISTGTIQPKEIIVGIDLGTTNSLIAIIHPATQQPIVLKEHDKSNLVPSIIHFDTQGTITVGEKAKEFLVYDPKRTIFSVKRLLGKRYKDMVAQKRYFDYDIINNEKDALVKVCIDGKFYSPIELSSMILKELKDRAEHILKIPIQKAVITVPAYFNDAQRQATKDAGKIAGLDVLRIINEPTAASLSYGWDQQAEDDKIIAVYDLGGGTFDVSILHLHQGIFEVLSTHGDTFLGGDDIDQLIIEEWIRDKKDISTVDRNKYRWQAEQVKKQLSIQEFAKVDDCSLTRDKLVQLMLPLVEKTIHCCKQAIKDAHLSIQDIHEVVMVGGSTRIPYIKKCVSDFFCQPVHDEINPDEAVALGAAIQAHILAGNETDTLLLDITPLSLGLETFGGLMDVLIPRNSKIPAKVSRQYTTQRDGQTSMSITIFQGERDLVADNRKLASFNLQGLPQMPAGLPKVEISFLINADGILTVTAKELRSGVSQSIEVIPQQGLDDEQVEKMLMESIMHAQTDMKNRSIIEAETEASQLIQLTDKFLQKHISIISKEEYSKAMQALEALKQVCYSKDKDVIHQHIEALNFATRPFAERVMNDAVKEQLRGKTI